MTATAETPKPVEHQTVEEHAAAGKAARAAVPRAAHAEFDLLPGRDPVAQIEQEGVGRLQDLLPLRYGRMLTSPFAFYRGTASLMARDLAGSPHSGLNVQLCGDAHLSNFGGFAAPDRSIVFDLNDFDESLPGPFEWDVKRLAASFEIAGRHRGLSKSERRAIVLGAVGWYRQSMREFAGLSNLGVWYARLEIAQILERLQASGKTKQVKSVTRATEKARSKDSTRALERLTTVVDGELQFVSQPPLIVPLHELLDENHGRIEVEEEIRDLLRRYRRTLQGDRRHLLETYRYVGIARKVVGVGSVGTRCWMILLLGRDEQDPLVLQVKEAGPSVLEAYLSKSRYQNSGQRIVEGQRMMQAASDIFLGWIRVTAGLDGLARDFYVRQLWDAKMSLDTETVRAEGLEIYAQVCGWTLARAHARSGDRVAITSYLGKSDVFDRAVADFSASYADLAEQDYAALAAAGTDGRIEVATVEA